MLPNTPETQTDTPRTYTPGGLGGGTRPERLDRAQPLLQGGGLRVQGVGVLVKLWADILPDTPKTATPNPEVGPQREARNLQHLYTALAPSWSKGRDLHGF